MRISILGIGAIATVLTINAYATSSTVTSRGYVDAQDALKQDIISTSMISIIDKGGQLMATLPSLVSYDSVDGLTGDKIGLVRSDVEGSYSYDPGSGALTGAWWRFAEYVNDNIVPTSLAVANLGEKIETDVLRRQVSIPESGYDFDGNAYSNNNPGAGVDSYSWLDVLVKGTGLVTKTSTNGVVGERKIFEASDLSGYSALTGNNKAIADISIPTVGAMMTAISNNQVTLPTGTAGNVVTYNSNGVVGGSVATYTGAAAYNATNDSAKIPTMAGVTTYAQAKKTCAGWPDGTTTPDATHTDANCWLWNLPD